MKYKITLSLFLWIFTTHILLSQVMPYSNYPQFEKYRIIHINEEVLNSNLPLTFNVFHPSHRGTFISSISITYMDRQPRSFNMIVLQDLPRMSVFISDENMNFTGPSKFKNGILNTNPFACQDCQIVLEFDEPLSKNIDLYFSVNETSKAETQSHIDPYIKRNSREEPVILVTGFWPPTNEMIRHFSQNSDLNPDGWQGNDWEGLGYDIISYFPQFSNPDCDDCGIGYGDFEVDYQDTSGDFWPILNQHQPVAMITFSRGYIDLSWELEYNFYNRTNWYGDYQTPVLPTPNPPDSLMPNYHHRYSSLPMENIVDAVDHTTLGLDPYIDWNGDPGHFVSEFMGYHGVWYRDLNQYAESPCYVAGHIHVGGNIDWDTARAATEISIRELITYLDQLDYTPGDINDDAIIDILDLVMVVNVIMGNAEFTLVQSYAADINIDEIINIQDIILIVNIILNP